MYSMQACAIFFIHWSLWRDQGKRGERRNEGERKEGERGRERGRRKREAGGKRGRRGGSEERKEEEGGKREGREEGGRDSLKITIRKMREEEGPT